MAQRKCGVTGLRTETGRVRMALLALVAASAFLLALLNVRANVAAPAGKVRTYYVAADQIEWNYAPSGKDQMMGMPFDGISKLYAEPGPHRLGRIVRKAIFQEYTDDSFKTVKPRPPSQQYLGLLGPLFRAEVGDTIKIFFRNHVTFPVSMHPHGVFYDKASEGAPYSDGGSKITERRGAAGAAPRPTSGRSPSAPDRRRASRARRCGSITRTLTNITTSIPAWSAR